jgi:hypothetical protein
MIFSSFKGINNQLSDTSFPVDYKKGILPLRNAVNVDIDDSGNIVLRPGSLEQYSGTDVHSWFEFEDDLGYGLFVDNGALYRLNKDYTATSLKTVSNIEMSYCILDGDVFFANGIDSGIYRNFVAEQWGITNPPNQPTAAATPAGGMYGGDYLVAITWLRGSGTHYVESGTYQSATVTVADGGGIKLTSFPTPPSDVTHIAVYVSAVDSKTLYLYDEYPASTTEVYIGYNVGTVELQTQFMEKSVPGLGLTVHNGGIFWREGNLVRYTEPHNPYLTSALNFFDMEDEIKVLGSIKTGPLYVQTKRGLYAINGVYNPEGPSAPQKIRTCDGPIHNAAYSPDYNECYLFNDIGFCKINFDGVTDLNFNDFAPPHFEKGTIAYMEQNGIAKLVFVGQNPTVHKLQHPDYSADETARHGTVF